MTFVVLACLSPLRCYGLDRAWLAQVTVENFADRAR